MSPLDSRELSPLEHPYGEVVWTVDCLCYSIAYFLMTEIPDAEMVVWVPRYHRMCTVSSMAPGIILGVTTPLDLIEEYCQG